MRPPDDMRDPVSYQFYTESEDWQQWKDTIPRSTPLDERLRTLIGIDTKLNGDTDVATLKLLDIKLDRVAQRCETALDALENENTSKAASSLDKIQEIVTAVNLE